MQGNSDSGIPEIFAFEISNPGNLSCGILNPGTFGFRNAAHGIQSPTDDWNSESKFYWQNIRIPVPGVRNPSVRSL